MGKGPGSTVPGSVTTTLSPTKKFAAPHTMPRTASPPSAARSPSGATRTLHQRIVLPFFCGSGVTSSTSPTTTGPETSPPWTVSSSKPTRTSASCSASGVACSGRSAHSRSHDRGILMSALRRPELPREPHVGLDHVPHVRQAVGELQGPLDAHAEREALVLLRVDAGGAQHVRVHHPASA